MKTNREILEELEQKLKYEKFKKELEDLGRLQKEEIKKKKQELFNIKHRKAIKVINFIGKTAETGLKELIEYSNSKKRVKNKK